MPLTTLQHAMQAFDGGALSFRNRLINGDMRIDQRYSGLALNATTANQYLVDRWAFSAGGTVSGTLTAQRVATSAPGGAQFAVRLARTSGTYVNSLVLVQVIESTNCYDLAGRTLTVSFSARKGSAYAASLTASVVTGTGVDEGVNGATGSTWTGYAAPGFVVPSLTTSFQTFSFNVTLGASVQEVGVHFNTGNFSGTGAAADYVDITDVQLELGTVATPFERRPFSLERILCQRYYQVFSNVTVEGYAVAGNQRAVQVPFPFPVAMRIAPARTTVTAGTYTNVRSSSATYAGLMVRNAQAATAFVEAAAAGYTQCVDQVEAMSAEL